MGRRSAALTHKRFSDVLGRFALDHAGHGLAREVEQRLDVQVVGRQNQLEQRRLIDFAELDVPRNDVVQALLVLLLLGLRRGVFVVILAVVNHFGQDWCAQNALAETTRRKKQQQR